VRWVNSMEEYSGLVVIIRTGDSIKAARLSMGGKDGGSAKRVSSLPR